MGCRRKMWLCLSLWYALVYVAERAHATDTSVASKFSNKALPLARNIANELSKVNRESENNYVDITATASSTGLLNGETGHFHNFSKLLHKSPIVVADVEERNSSRIGYEKDLMLVLPVNANTNGSDSQMWYTQMPVTAIIEDHDTSKLEHRVDYDVYEDPKQDDDRHPYTNFLVNKPMSKPKSPLDYGYPESFKFVEDLNGLPSNHKPEWASTDSADLEESTLKTKATTELTTSTKYNPFELFESVKPLEINKLFSMQQPVPASGSDLEETTTEKHNVTESHIHTIPKRPFKRPTKKPQKTKLTTETTTSYRASQTSTTSSTEPVLPMDSDQLYTAVRYTTLLSESTKEFLPHSHSTKIKPINIHNSFQHHISSTTSTTTEVPYAYKTKITTTDVPQWYKTKATTTTTPEVVQWHKVTSTTSTTTEAARRYNTTDATSTADAISSPKSTFPPSIVYTMSKSPTKVVTSSSTTTAPITTTISALLNSINDIPVYNVTEDVDEEYPSFEDQVDLNVPQNLSDFQPENFQPPKDINSFPSEVESLKETNPTISGDMLTNDMKNMLISLGILKSEQISTTSTTEMVIIRREPVTPNINANSYASFKKIPTDYKQQPDKSNISDDMKDLLASFGLLPKKVAHNETSRVRISRQQNLTEINSTNLNGTTNFTDEGNNEETNFDIVNILKPNSSVSNPNIDADVASFFKDGDNSSDKPMAIDSDFLSTDEMRNTLENLGFVKQSAIHNRSPKSGHVFQPTSHLEKLNKDDNAKKITDVIRTIKTLSIKTETNDISDEELEKQLLNLTATIENENFGDINETLLFELNEFLTNDTNLKIVESIENMTNKMQLNKTKSSPEATTVSLIEKEKSTSTTETVTVNLVERKKPSSKTTSTTETATENLVERKKPSSKTISSTETVTTGLIKDEKPSQNTTSTTEAIKINLTESSVTNKTRLEIEPPNPLSTDELLQLYEMGKNEIKRQQSNPTNTSLDTLADQASSTFSSSNDDTSIPGASTETFISNTLMSNINIESTSTSTSSISSSTSTEVATDTKVAENNNAPIADLADSFGGAEVASEEPSADDLPTPKPNGLYFFLDWNTFLNVGEEDKNPIRIRFSPRAGNARNFLPITVP